MWVSKAYLQSHEKSQLYDKFRHRQLTYLSKYYSKLSFGDCLVHTNLKQQLWIILLIKEVV